MHYSATIFAAYCISQEIRRWTVLLGMVEGMEKDIVAVALWYCGIVDTHYFLDKRIVDTHILGG